MGLLVEAEIAEEDLAVIMEAVRHDTLAYSDVWGCWLWDGMPMREGMSEIISNAQEARS